MEKQHENPEADTALRLLSSPDDYDLGNKPLHPSYASTAAARTLQDLFYPLDKTAYFEKFKDEKDEERYKNLRQREKNEGFFLSYPEAYRQQAAVFHGLGSHVMVYRSLMVRWMKEISTAMDCSVETLFLAVGLFDKFLSKGFSKSVELIQKAGVACFYLATKLEEPYSFKHVQFKVQTQTYSIIEITEMERMILNTLEFRCFLPTVHNFLGFYLKAAEADHAVKRRATELALQGLLDLRLLAYLPSTVAAGVVILTLLEHNMLQSATQVSQVHVRAIDNNLERCIEILEHPQSTESVYGRTFWDLARLDYDKALFSQSTF